MSKDECVEMCFAVVVVTEKQNLVTTTLTRGLNLL